MFLSQIFSLPPSGKDNLCQIRFGISPVAKPSLTAANRLLQGCLDETRALLSVYSEDSPVSTAASKGREKLGTTRSSSCQEDHRFSTRTPPSHIQLVGDDIAEGHWCDATLVYAASAFFDDALMLDIETRCRSLREGARVVTLDRPLPSVLSGGIKEGSAGARGDFEVEWQCQVDGCWGGSSVAFVHRLQPPRVS